MGGKPVCMQTQFKYDFISGSMGDESLDASDIDIILKIDDVLSEDDLIPTEEALFVRVKWREGTCLIPYYGFDRQGNPCINGFQMKQRQCEIDQSAVVFKQNLQVSVDKANVLLKPLFEPTPVANLVKAFPETLKSIELTMSSPQKRTHFRLLYEEIFDKQLKGHHWKSDKELFQLPILLMGSAFGYSLSKRYKQQLGAFIDFYSRHRHFVKGEFSTKYLQDIMDKISNYDCDIIFAIRLNFWPKDLQPFLKRFQKSKLADRVHQEVGPSKCMKYERWTLGKKVEATFLHLVPKWSAKTPLEDREYEFRYSFSAIEHLIAKSRSPSERLLGKIARNIYNKYLKDDKSEITSYFVKTSVLWMCETTELDNEPEVLATLWISHVCVLLKQGQCSHYFMDSVNILESLTKESFEKAVHILEGIKDLNDCINMNDSKPTVFDENLHQMAVFRDWIEQIKISDLLSAHKDWIQMTQQFGFGVIDQVSNPFASLGLLFGFAIIDGPDGSNNVSEWKRLFIDRNNSDQDDDFVRNWCEQHEKMSAEAGLLNSLMFSWMGLITVNDYLNRLSSSTTDEFLTITQNNNFGLFIRICDALGTCKLFSLRRDELFATAGNTVKELLENPHVSALMSSIAAQRTKEKENEEAMDKAIRDDYQEEEQQYLDDSILAAAIQESIERVQEEH
ncbi:unnamed protein product [Didymodactylos carnosus]|uniref:Mab-21-like HhH/H2TH-like domain-containing protein n=1 Tax=Didymodactylos carnosus TaxID=1234261 RepID=A0A814ZA32_9BILA|nr:unnamed protein product [Didymodactylos carnosus]CAF4001278.1 unnamed protein product [Didymodactylos carnosus]